MMNTPTTIKALPWRHVNMGTPGLILGLETNWYTRDPRGLDSLVQSMLMSKHNVLEHAAIRVSWKALRDPRYAHVASKYQSWFDLEEAGLFDDGWSPAEWNQRFDLTKAWYTPMPDTSNINKLADFYHENKHDVSRKPVVLIMPGALAPAHEGHARALIAARDRALQQGWIVLGAYLSPSHDNYVSSKLETTTQYTAQERIDVARRLLSGIGGLYVDPWEALGVPVALNYTDVIDRIGFVYSQTFGFNVTPVLVAGTDNAGFAMAFEKLGCSIFVQRNPHKAPEETKNVLVVKHAVSDIQSRLIRQFPGFKPQTKYVGHLLRNDCTHAVSQWFDNHDAVKLGSALGRFIRELRSAIQVATPPSWRIRDVYLPEQQKIFDNLIEKVDRPFGVLDPCLDCSNKNAFQLRGSRVFQLSGNQQKPVGYIWHHEILPIENFIENLIDDDSVTGRTFDEAEKLLCVKTSPKRYTLANLQCVPDGLDPIDARDFLIGSTDGGLVVQQPKSGVMRVPYWAPFVNLAQRASIPPDACVSFTKAVIRANIRFYEQVYVLMNEVDPMTRIFLDHLGFDPTDDMEYICSCLLNEI